MRIGLTLPQGCDREFVGMDVRSAWQRTVEIARQAEDAGVESLWIYDHFQVDPPPEEAPLFEPMVELAGIAVTTRRARLGHLVLAAAYRNAGLTAKMISTVDVLSGGRTELGIGAGWKEDEWRSYGYGFPPARERLAILEDHLEIITRMLAPGRATYTGAHASVTDAIHLPDGLQQPRMPILIGGNGPKVTWRLAARFADELNLDAMRPEEVARALPIIAERCEEVGRDPASLRVSVHVWLDPPPAVGGERQELLHTYAELGLARAMVQGFPAVKDSRYLELLLTDCAAAGLLDARS